MHPDLEKYIDFAVADGEVSESEKAILIRKAKELDIQLDELEMVLEAKLHMIQKETKEKEEVKKENTQKSSIQESSSSNIKCPQCSALIESFATRCAYCDAEIKNIKSAQSVLDFFNKFSELSEPEVDPSSNPFKAMGTMMAESMQGGIGGVNKRQKNLIRNFPVPNAKEDILEFLSLAVPRARTLKSGFGALFKGQAQANTEHNALSPIWKSKCEQIIMKARWAMKEDKTLLDEIESYTQELGIK